MLKTNALLALHARLVLDSCLRNRRLAASRRPMQPVVIGFVLVFIASLILPFFAAPRVLMTACFTFVEMLLVT